MFQVKKNRESKDSQRNQITDTPKQTAANGGEKVTNAPAPKKESSSVALIHQEDVNRRPSEFKNGQMGALLGRGSRFEGKLTFEGTVQVDGEFYGDIESAGHLIVTESAKIEGTVQVSSAQVSGEINGTITTKGVLDLRSTARVVGELNVRDLTVEKGAFFQGEVKMKRGEKNPV